MDDRSARRDLALVAVTVVGLSRLVEPPLIWLVAGALLGAMLLGTLQVLNDEVAPAQAWFGIPIESLILPSVAAVACLGAIRLVPFGLWLAPEARGRGVGTRSLRLASDWTFATTAAIRLDAFIMVGNEASNRMVERAGFQREGVARAWDIHHDGVPVDCTVYSRIRGDA